MRGLAGTGGELPGSLRRALRAGGWGPLDSLCLFHRRTRAPRRRRGPRTIRGWCGALVRRWSCRESNPGPLALSQVFSGCSASCRFSQPWCSDEHVTNRLSHEKVPIASRDATRSASPLDETDDPGRGRSRVCPSPVAVRQRGRSQCAWNRHLWFATNVKEMTSRSLPASPESNDQSRNRSAPLELSTDTHLHRHGVSITVQPRDDTAHSSRHRTPPSVAEQRQQPSCGCSATERRGAVDGLYPKTDCAHSGWSMNGLRLPW